MHAIKPAQQHAVVNVRLAIAPEYSSSEHQISDGLSEMFNSAIRDGLIADFETDVPAQPHHAEASLSPCEGELFEQTQEFMLCVQDPDYEESWYHITSDKLLNNMNEDALIATLEDVIHIGSDDRVFVTNIKGPQRLSV